jgi:hypothetical protein
MSTQAHTFEIDAVAPGARAARSGGPRGLPRRRRRVGRGRPEDAARVAGDRAAFTLRCTYPGGEAVLGNALCQLRDGKIMRWSAVQAWDG